MAEYDADGRRLTIKLVYYGPAQSGKTTNLMRLHDLFDPTARGEMMTLETQSDRTLFFDLLPLGFTAPSGLHIKLKLFTVPGQVQHDSTRKAVLSRADGVVFVADSQRTQSVNNGEAFENLAANAARVGLEFERLPLVVQFNKRDLAGILSEEEVQKRWQGAPWPLLFATALIGKGVRETFVTLLGAVHDALDRELQLDRTHRLDRNTFITAVAGGPHGRVLPR